MADRVTELGGFNVMVQGRDALYIVNKHDQYVGRSLILYGEYCQAEFDLFSKLTGAGSVIAEVGANLGAHTVRLAKHVGLNGRVVAFEPQPPIFQALCGTIAANALMNVDAFPFGLADEKRIARLPRIDYRQANNFGGLPMHDVDGESTAVHVDRLDDIWILPRLDFLKIDVEGMELEVLIGAEKSVEKFRPVIYFENDTAEKSAPLLQWVMERDYRLWWHMPPLYNPGNFFGNAENVFGSVQSVNVLAIHKTVNVEIGMPEITDPAQYPTKTVVGQS